MKGSGFRVNILGSKPEGFGSRGQDFMIGIKDVGLRIKSSGFDVQGLKFGFKSSGFRI